MVNISYGGLPHTLRVYKTMHFEESAVHTHFDLYVSAAFQCYFFLVRDWSGMRNYTAVPKLIIDFSST